jgi:riboflavin-specific deaminase-like protein
MAGEIAADTMAIIAITEQLLADTATRAALLGRPVVTLSYAQSFDGSLAARRGEALLLSGAESKTMTHQLRAAHAGILVGIGTVLADDPRLTARLAGGPDPQPVVLDGMLRIPVECRLLASAERMPWILCGPRASLERKRELEEKGARVVVVEEDQDARIHLSAALKRLYTLGLSSLMVEGGVRVITSFLRERLVDQAVVTIAPVWIGGLNALSGSMGKSGVYPFWHQPVIEACGRDWVVWGKLGEEKYETTGPVFSGAGTS